MAIKTDEQAEEVIRLQGIGKSYYIGDQEVPVLTHIDLSITKGEFVSIMGPSGAGKSTLMNHLIGQKIAITSNKPQTTRNRIQTVYTGPKGQIVFLDTPGIHKAKNKLGNYMVKVAESTFSDVDVILWLVEPTTYIGAGERHILEQ